MFKDAIEKYGFLMADGAMATELEYMGYDLSSNLWSAQVLLENEAAIQAVHESYLVAGSNILTTATYQATYQRLMEYGYTKGVINEVFNKSIHLARKAIREKPQTHPVWVAASIGPYGAYLADGSEYTGNYNQSAAELTGFHRLRFEQIMAAHPDLVAFETIPCLAEIQAICNLLSEHNSAQAWVSLNCRSGEVLASGEPLEEAMSIINACSQVIAVGGNCVSPSIITPIIQTIKAHTNLPIIIYPNSGELWDAQNRCWVADVSTPHLSDYVIEWANAGARIFGGCCRTQPTDIQKMKTILASIKE